MSLSKEIEDRELLQKRLEDRIQAIVTNSAADLLVAPRTTPLMSSTLMSGRRMGKTTMARQWVETYGEIITKEPMSPADFRKEYLCDFSTTATVSNASSPWASRSSDEIVADMRRVAEEIGPCRWTPAISNASIAGGMITAAKIGDSPMGILDSTASAAAGLAREMKGNDMDDTTKNQLEAIGAALMNHDATTVKGPFGLTGPVTLTIKTRQSQFKKKAFLGDEKFVLASTYIGKKDMILVFKNTRPVDYAFMEMPLDEALNAMTGFKEFANAAAGGDIHGTLANIETVKTQERRAETEVLMQDPEFASW